MYQKQTFKVFINICMIEQMFDKYAKIQASMKLDKYMVYMLVTNIEFVVNFVGFEMKLLKMKVKLFTQRYNPSPKR